MPVQFVWQDLKTDFSEFDACHGYDRSMSHMFGICVLGNSGYCQILHHDFWLVQIALCLDLELSVGNYVRIFPADGGYLSCLFHSSYVCVDNIKLGLFI